jgi:hypothetical protein
VTQDLCDAYVVATFTNVYRGSQPATFAPLCTPYCLFPFKTDTVFRTVKLMPPPIIYNPNLRRYLMGEINALPISALMYMPLNCFTLWSQKS